MTAVVGTFDMCRNGNWTVEVGWTVRLWRSEAAMRVFSDFMNSIYAGINQRTISKEVDERNNEIVIGHKHTRTYMTQA